MGQFVPHTPAMVREELISMVDDISCGGIVITVGDVVRLFLSGSPFINGGIVDSVSIEKAREIIGSCASAEEISSAIATAFRGLEIIESSAKNSCSQNSGDVITPELLADFYAAVCRAAPATTWATFIDEMPFVVAAHLAAAAHRAAGGHTSRPIDYMQILKEIDEASSKIEK